MADTIVKRMQVGLGVAGALAVALGAFGSHGLKGMIEPSLISTWKTGVQYHFFHLVLLYAAMSKYQACQSWAALWSYRLTAVGILLFSGSLYLLASREPLGITGWTWLGPVTPIGGLCLIAGWLSYTISARHGTRANNS